VTTASNGRRYEARVKLAVTGGTGFVGSHLLDVAVGQGHEVIALTRREQPARDRVRWVRGSLDDREALRCLVEDADAVIHVAGVINASDASGFTSGNVDGTLAILAAATATGITRFVHVSSLAAREPQLSLYGASKAKAEELVAASGLEWAIVRPPAVYGPGDRETLDLFKMAARGQILMPPRGSLSMIHVEDLARLLLVFAGPQSRQKIIVEPDDGKEGGWTHRELGAALGNSVGRPVRTFSTPRPLLALASRVDRLVRGPNAKLTADRVAYFCHPDWVANGERRVPEALWKPQVDTIKGLKQTADWYRAHGWL
jgi:nucleoside-diphosphate-sugar epimerase